MPDEALYRPCVGIILFNDDNKVFVGERIDTPGAWQMPQGGIDKGETIQQAALRELKEETGTDQADIIRVAEEKLRYDLPEHLRTNLWDGKYAGQEQSWVAMRFTGDDLDIDLDSHQPPEFSAWQWINFRQSLELIVPFKRDVYTRLIDLFSDLL